MRPVAAGAPRRRSGDRPLIPATLQRGQTHVASTAIGLHRSAGRRPHRGRRSRSRPISSALAEPLARRRPRVRAPPFVLLAGRTWATARRVQIPRRFCILRRRAASRTRRWRRRIAARPAAFGPGCIGRGGTSASLCHGLTILRRVASAGFRFAFEQLAQVVARLRVQRIGGHLPDDRRPRPRSTVAASRAARRSRSAPRPGCCRGRARPCSAPRPSPTASVTAVERDQIGVRLRERSRASAASCASMAPATSPASARRRPRGRLASVIVANGRHACGERVVDRRPSSPCARAARARHAPVAAFERAQRLREAVVGVAKLREERDGALEVRDRVGVPALARRDAPEAKLAHGGSGRLRRQLPHTPARSRRGHRRRTAPLPSALALVAARASRSGPSETRRPPRRPHRRCNTIPSRYRQSALVGASAWAR